MRLQAEIEVSSTVDTYESRSNYQTLQGVMTKESRNAHAKMGREEETLAVDVFEVEGDLLLSIYREDDFANDIKGLYVCRQRLLRAAKYLLLTAVLCTSFLVLFTVSLVLVLLSALHALDPKNGWA